jgi:Rab-GTPase-TBC domain
MKELIKQDVVRTNQEFAYFKKQSTKDMLTSLLYLWGKTYPAYGYKQGMNEILAIVLIVFDTERLEPDLDWTDLSDQEIAENHLIEYLFDARHLQADVFMAHDRILQLGVQQLYQDTKDISQLMQDQARRNTTEEKRKRDLFEPSMNKAKE